MKLKGESRLGRRRSKAGDVLRSPEVASEVVFSPERDLGEAYCQDLLKRAEEYLQQEEDEDGEEPERFRAIPFLAAYKLLFPRYQSELDVLMKRYKVKEEVVDQEGDGFSFLDKMILFPEKRQDFTRQADARIRSNPSLSTGQGIPLDLLLPISIQMLSVQPELMQTLRLKEKKRAIFRLLEQTYEGREWAELIQLAAIARLLFPDEFNLNFLQGSDWDILKKKAKEESYRPELGLNLAILAAEQVHFLPEGEVKVTFPTPALKSKPELPSRELT